VLHIMAVVQLRNPTEGRAYYDRKVAAGKTPREAMRALKRRLPRRRLPPDDHRCPGSGNGPGRTHGGGYRLQRGRLEPQHRHFGEVTSRTRHRRPYARKAISFSWPFPAAFISAGPQPPSSALCLTRARTGAHYPAGK